ncbi:hypothetical protein A2130_04750 [Candidatus Woesebacteria bacterium GWC2_33_12]|uniref:Uncharacterized protein n=1 Tax=Candidatus Woesebacteria bacterium GW2011_GWB1_33_22 TaxID=1618566 RepID=A0A0F9ZLV2_9BACT|nr:MAG: hypothetical protein UR29_C0005G0047 [Candidatus Woesebacteria bacterium GW2011_GWC2_33_12]KKP42353.1 MAG: hypothetical protein UR33_C0003G0046 [Candidatus Woesebacteria bacterium GW2011_GWA2_33_20]KKP45104.1 MAG: hypothetical protein UR35_C0003G0046 [Candidatus Woesebacteria bacterium GW2011_GWB1_33_22]KKP46980.1 MAG: hypothetical protein UR37_C0003G0046 [Microgenomates group bacterium GW2011_GWC1_33_28]KKP50806.1 MAG: hypothetical protein UR41_C0003G0046 [Candidatus Woesebacteria bact
MTNDEMGKGVNIARASGASADLFMTSTEQMEMDNFQRRFRGVLKNLVKRYKKPENELLDLANDTTMLLEPDGYKAISKWADMQEKFRLDK